MSPRHGGCPGAIYSLTKFPSIPIVNHYAITTGSPAAFTCLPNGRLESDISRQPSKERKVLQEIHHSPKGLISVEFFESAPSQLARSFQRFAEGLLRVGLVLYPLQRW